MNKGDYIGGAILNKVLGKSDNCEIWEAQAIDEKIAVYKSVIL